MELRTETVMVALAAGFDRDPEAARAGFRDLLASQPEAFLRGALALFCKGLPAGPADAIVRILHVNDMLLSALCDPSVSGPREALAMARVSLTGDPSLDIKIAKTLGEGVTQSPYLVMRALDLLAEISSASRVMPQLMQLLRAPNERVRSKAVLMIGQAKRDPRWLEPYLRDPNPRMRSNAVEALWGLDSREAIDIFHTACMDSHHRVAANGCVGLHLAGSTDGVLQIEQLANFADPMYQAAEAWAMGMTGDPVFTNALVQMARSPSPPVRQSALRALATIRKSRG